MELVYSESFMKSLARLDPPVQAMVKIAMFDLQTNPRTPGFNLEKLLANDLHSGRINDNLRLHPNSRKEVQETLAFFDGMSFAERITSPIVVNIGLQDNICPPETGYEVFNKIASEDKRLYAYDSHAHDAGSHEHSQIIDAFFSRHLNP